MDILNNQSNLHLFLKYFTSLIYFHNKIPHYINKFQFHFYFHLYKNNNFLSRSIQGNKKDNSNITLNLKIWQGNSQICNLNNCFKEKNFIIYILDTKKKISSLNKNLNKVCNYLKSHFRNETLFNILHKLINYFYQHSKCNFKFLHLYNFLHII